MQCTLAARVGASSFSIPWQNLGEWKPVLGCADGLVLKSNGTQVLSLELGDTRRWIAFEKMVNASPCHCIGYQETVRGVNKKVLVWHRPDGAFFVGNEPR